MKKPPVIRFLLVLSVMSLAIMACLGSGASENKPDTAVEDSPAEAEQVDPIEDASDSSSSDPQSADNSTIADGDIEVDEPDVSPPDPNRDLGATDPATVQLATGNPQLVEFFSYT